MTSGARRTSLPGVSSGAPKAAAANTAWLAVAASVVGAVVAACGPSVQSIYEGNVRFEHCYRLDLDLEIAPTHRAACWREWLRTNLDGQPRDRVEYARRRVRAFAAGDLSRPVLDTRPRSETALERAEVLPSPTSAHAPPPQLAPKRAPIPAPSSSPTGSTALGFAPANPNAPAPGAECATACEVSWRSCRAACEPGGGASEAACLSCEPDYKACVRRCYE